MLEEHADAPVGVCEIVDPQCRAGAAHPDEAIDHELLSRAMAYGTALASYNVEEFGTERVERLTADEVQERVADLQRMTSFTVDPVARRV